MTNLQLTLLYRPLSSEIPPCAFLFPPTRPDCPCASHSSKTLGMAAGSLVALHKFPMFSPNPFFGNSSNATKHTKVITCHSKNGGSPETAYLSHHWVVFLRVPLSSSTLPSAWRWLLLLGPGAKGCFTACIGRLDMFSWWLDGIHLISFNDLMCVCVYILAFFPHIK